MESTNFVSYVLEYYSQLFRLLGGFLRTCPGSITRSSYGALVMVGRPGNDWLLVDGRNLIWRAAQANPELSVKIGDNRVHTGGIYGFILTLIAVHQRYGGKTIIAWEGTNNFRFELFPQYKPREATEEREAWVKSLDDQQRRLKLIMTCAGVPQYTGERCEADDVLATLAYQLKGRVTIYTMDSDLRQCVNDRVTVVSAGFKGGDIIYDAAQVMKRHGVKPIRIPDLKALAGDPSDGIPGVHGIGDKTAQKLLVTYEKLETVLGVTNAGSDDELGQWPVSQRFIKAIADETTNLELYKTLTTVLRDATLHEIAAKRNRAKLEQKLLKYRFRTLSYRERIDALLSLVE
jgi:5'-3' exonuclease